MPTTTWQTQWNLPKQESLHVVLHTEQESNAHSINKNKILFYPEFDSKLQKIETNWRE